MYWLQASTCSHVSSYLTLTFRVIYTSVTFGLPNNHYHFSSKQTGTKNECQLHAILKGWSFNSFNSLNVSLKLTVLSLKHKDPVPGARS